MGVVRRNYHYLRIRYNDTKSEHGINFLVESAPSTIIIVAKHSLAPCWIVQSI